MRQAPRYQSVLLLVHGLGVSDGGGEESIPFKSAIQSSPVIVPVTCVRQAPRYQGVLLLVCRVALGLSISTAAHPPLGPSTRLAVLHVVVTIDQLAALGSILQRHNLIRQVSPV